MPSRRLACAHGLWGAAAILLHDSAGQRQASAALRSEVAWVGRVCWAAPCLTALCTSQCSQGFCPVRENQHVTLVRTNPRTTLWQVSSRILPHRQRHHDVAVALPNVDLGGDILQPKTPRSHQDILIPRRPLHTLPKGLNNVFVCLFQSCQNGFISTFASSPRSKLPHVPEVSQSAADYLHGTAFSRAYKKPMRSRIASISQPSARTIGAKVEFRAYRAPITPAPSPASGAWGAGSLIASHCFSAVRPSLNEPSMPCANTNAPFS